MSQKMNQRSEIYFYFRIFLAAIFGFWGSILFFYVGLPGAMPVMAGALLTTFCFYISDQTTKLVTNYFSKERANDPRNQRSSGDSDE